MATADAALQPNLSNQFLIHPLSVQEVGGGLQASQLSAGRRGCKTIYTVVRSEMQGWPHLAHTYTPPGCPVGNALERILTPPPPQEMMTHPSSVQEVGDELEVPQLRAGRREGVILGLTVHPQHGGRALAAARRVLTDLRSRGFSRL